MGLGHAHTMYRQPVPKFLSAYSKGQGGRGISRDTILPLLTTRLWIYRSGLTWGKRKFDVVMLLKL